MVLEFVFTAYSSECVNILLSCHNPFKKASCREAGGGFVTEVPGVQWRQQLVYYQEEGSRCLSRQGLASINLASLTQGEMPVERLYLERQTVPRE